MSRIGNKIINIPTGIEVFISDTNLITVKSNKGFLETQFSPILSIKKEGTTIKIIRPNDDTTTKKLHGTTRALLANMINGLSSGFSKTLEVHGVGYRVALEGNNLSLVIGKSHPVLLPIPQGLKVELPKPTEIVVSGADKQKLGQFCAEIRNYKKPEPYKGKGIRYRGEHVRRKAGKTAK